MHVYLVNGVAVIEDGRGESDGFGQCKVKWGAGHYLEIVDLV